MAVTGTDFVTLQTQDIERARTFYRDTLGLEESTQWGELPAFEFETGNLTIAVMDPSAFGMPFQTGAAASFSRSTISTQPRRSSRMPGSSS